VASAHPLAESQGSSGHDSPIPIPSDSSSSDGSSSGTHIRHDDDDDGQASSSDSSSSELLQKYGCLQWCSDWLVPCISGAVVPLHIKTKGANVETATKALGLNGVLDWDFPLPSHGVLYMGPEKLLRALYNTVLWCKSLPIGDVRAAAFLMDCGHESRWHMILDTIEAWQAFHATACIHTTEDPKPMQEVFKLFPVLRLHSMPEFYDTTLTTHAFSEFFEEERDKSMILLTDRMHGAFKFRSLQLETSITLMESLGIPKVMNFFDTSQYRISKEETERHRALITEDTRCVLDTLFGGPRSMPRLPVDLTPFADYLGSRVAAVTAAVAEHSRKRCRSPVFRGDSSPGISLDSGESSDENVSHDGRSYSFVERPGKRARRW
jgi:hypothetical protein